MRRKIYILMLCLSFLLISCKKENNSSEDAESTAQATEAVVEATEGAEATESTITSVNLDEVVASIQSYKDNVTLGTYKGLEVAKEEVEVTDEELQAKVDSILEENADRPKLEEGEVKDGDMINIDFTGYIDGEAFENGSATGYDLTIGSAAFIDGFEEGLIGAKVGEEKELDLTFPEDYYSEDLQGKDVMFKVKVNYLYDKILPEWNDAFVAEVTSSEYTTTKDYEDKLRADLLVEEQATADSNTQQLLLSQLLTNCEVKEFPQDELDSFVQKLKDYYTDMADEYNMAYEDLIYSLFTMQPEQMDENMLQNAKTVLAQKMIILTIGEVEGILPKGNDLVTKVQEVVEQNGYTDLDTFAADFGANTAVEEAYRIAVMDWLVANANIK
ncbi:trigger factor [Anaeromicropila populeti]|uniref:peptidylprolyl isomerase n=1 Tax=Anaeromicropila populeti TaxID=37658 RepID=A0A1I6I8P3_9FIRM|nr:trigger factor [Anaeromicropila populeti]SFR63105.1 trigger factor [Anaeromicropila populeti]